MRSTLTEAEVMAYQVDGFVVVPALLTAREVQGWRTRITAAAQRRVELPPEGRLGVLDRDSQPNDLFLQHVNLWQTDPGMRELVLDGALSSLVAQLEGVRSVRLCFDSLLIKRPFAMASRFHLDLPHWSVTSNHAATIWIALDDVDVTNGCMCYLPGTHQFRRTEPVNTPQGFRSLFERYPDWAEITPTFCCLTAGDAVVHHALTAHGSTANFRPAWRWAMTIAYVAADATFNGHRSPLFAMPEHAEPGDVLPDDEHPVVFQRSERAKAATPEGNC